MAQELSCSLPRELETEALVAALVAALARHSGAGRLAVGEPVALSRQLTWLDTFDWRLARAGWTLRAARVEGEGEGFDLTLVPVPSPAAGDDLHRRLHCARLPAFPGDLPAGTLRDTLAPLTGVRRLLPVVTVGREGLLLPLLDGASPERHPKTLGHLAIEERHALPPGGRRRRPLLRRLRLAPLAGYGPRCIPPVRAFAAELGLAEIPGSELTEALAALGRTVGDYSARLDLELDGESRADRAMRGIFRHLLGVLLANEPGVRGALDIEFLHDFRVAVRRMRSALTQVRGVFAPEQVELLGRELAWLGRVTGPKRDHDVLLETLDDYLEGLPEWARQGLEGLRSCLRAQEGHVQEELVAALDSERYRTLVGELGLLVRAPKRRGPEPVNAPRSIAEVAAERLLEVAKMVRRKAAAIRPESPTEEVHRLRIKAKKYRYLLEMFRSLYPAGEFAEEIKTLKQLQDVLGTYNDLANQQLSVLHLARTMELPEGGVGEGFPLAPPLAMGFLIAHLGERQRAVRGRLGEALALYLRKKNRRREKHLFSPGRVR